MKKGIKSAILLITAFQFFSGCNKNQKNIADSEKITVISTIFPAYDWVQEITAETPSIKNELLIKNGVDLHSFQPSAADIIKIASADILIYVGGESDSWINDILKTSASAKLKTINLMECLEENIYEEEIVEGMESDEEDCEEPEYDEHVWLSLINADTICWKITKLLCQLDETNSTVYENNMKNYEDKLKSLYSEYQRAVSNSKNTIIFADRFPFRYLAEDFNLKYYAAFAGCSAETEASFETVAFLANKLSELNLPVVFTIETSDKKLAETVINNSKNKAAKIEVMDSMQNTTFKQAEEGKTYLNTMEKNLAALKLALQ